MKNNKISLLYIDDEPINLMIFEELFEQEYNIITADSGIKGLDILDLHKEIKVVISDMKMIGMNGLEFIKNASFKFPQISYFILTGYELSEELAKAVEKKIISKCLHKPINYNEIVKSVKLVLNH